MKKQNNSIKLHVQIASVSDAIPTRSEFLRWIKAILLVPAELTIRLTDEQESAALNQKYRSKQGPTNVLSFPVENAPDAKCPYLGDLVICAPLVAQEAQQQNKPVIHHWAHLTVHGVLHLLGYDHEQEQEAEIMEQLEVDVLNKLGFPDPY